RLWLALTIVPILRIISFSLPLATFHLMYWYLITSVPVFIGAILIIRQLGFSWRDVGVNGRNRLWQIPLFLSGLLIGYMEYLILRPWALVEGLGWAHIVAAALILLISTGFLEELIFRRMLQQVAVDQWGRAFGIVYVAAIFGVLHVGYSSFLDVAFVFGIGLFFGWAADKTGSIVGVTLAHGLANITLFLILPALGFADNALVIPHTFWYTLQEYGIWMLLLMAGFGLMRLMVIEPQMLD
ncbi:MAG: CPBP family intramembrane metalloprotease, partial [Anaerolineales bacterium]|nr:CPBP family intramembrane metalloprotease [Anaerolineales bacterium]